MNSLASATCSQPHWAKIAALHFHAWICLSLKRALFYNADSGSLHSARLSHHLSSQKSDPSALTVSIGFKYRACFLRLLR